MAHEIDEWKKLLWKTRYKLWRLAEELGCGDQLVAIWRKEGHFVATIHSGRPGEGYCVFGNRYRADYY